MKIHLVFLLLALLSAKVYCQSKNNFSFVFGAGSNDIRLIGPGGPGYKGNGEIIYGLNYTRSITKMLSIETGLEYSVNNLLWDYEDAYAPSFTPQKGSIRMLSVPLYANFTFLRYVFADVGIVADFETNYNSTNTITPKQTGIGFATGIGGKYNVDRMTLFVNLFLQAHSIITFQNEGSGSLLNSGVKFGIGYGF